MHIKKNVKKSDMGKSPDERGRNSCSPEAVRRMLEKIGGHRYEKRSITEDQNNATPKYLLLPRGGGGSLRVGGRLKL